MDGPPPGLPARGLRAIVLAADVGVPAGLVLYCILEFGSTGGFLMQRPMYATPEETRAAVLLGIGAGFVAVAWFFLQPIGRLFAIGNPRTSGRPISEPLVATGLEGREPSPRSLSFLLLGETTNFFLATFGVLALMGGLLIPVQSYLPEALPYIFPGGLLLLVWFIWSRVARLRRLCRIGAEVEGRLAAVLAGDEGSKTAHYEYFFDGQRGDVTNTSWWLKRLALRHGDRVIVLVDPRNPDDAVILGRYPTS